MRERESESGRVSAKTIVVWGSFIFCLAGGGWF